MRNLETFTILLFFVDIFEVVILDPKHNYNFDSNLEKIIFVCYKFSSRQNVQNVCGCITEAINCCY